MWFNLHMFNTTCVIFSRFLSEVQWQVGYLYKKNKYVKEIQES